VKFATSENITARSTMFSHRNFHKYTWNSLDGKRPIRIDNILLYESWHSNCVDVQYLREAHCDSVHYLMVANLERDCQYVNEQERSLIFRDLI
jgi:hypothetical protein